MKRGVALLVSVLFGVGFAGIGVQTASADPDQIKAYKAAYEGAKPKCIWCHAVEKPKKEDGQHELNEYGKKAKALLDEPAKKLSAEEIYKSIGKNPSEED